MKVGSRCTGMPAASAFSLRLQRERRAARLQGSEYVPVLVREEGSLTAKWIGREHSYFLPKLDATGWPCERAQHRPHL